MEMRNLILLVMAVVPAISAQVINPCSIANGGCEHICTNTGPGTAVCSCATGYILDPDNQGCTPANNPCTVLNGGCEHICTHTGPGTAVCSCVTGFTLDPDNHGCTPDANPCSYFPCEHICTNVGPRALVCSCNTGYFLNPDGLSCTAIDPCSVVNGGCENICTNTGPGTAVCSCVTGFTLDPDNHGCTPVSGKCQKACRLYDKNSRCDRRIGCICKKKYHLENGKCVRDTR